MTGVCAQCKGQGLMNGRAVSQRFSRYKKQTPTTCRLQRQGDRYTLTTSSLMWLGSRFTRSISLLMPPVNFCSALLGLVSAMTLDTFATVQLAWASRSKRRGVQSACAAGSSTNSPQHGHTRDVSLQGKQLWSLQPRRPTSPWHSSAKETGGQAATGTIIGHPRALF